MSDQKQINNLRHAVSKSNFYVKKIIQNPRLIKKGIIRVNKAITWRIKKLPSPKKYLYSFYRYFQRKQNKVTHSKRALIYVIYENKERLQPYKLIFLNSLAQLVEEVFIVINGDLPEKDLSDLKVLGQVYLRENEGYDTAAFRYGIQQVGSEKLKSFDELLLVNDTNVGPFSELTDIFSKMNQKNVDFWGISYGEQQPDFTGLNKYRFIPVHLQSYFLVIRGSLLRYKGFYEYWEKLTDTNSRDKAIGLHETVFTKHFEDLGFKHCALSENNIDSPMYIHPLTMVKEGIPIVKYTAFSNYTNDKFAWQGLKRETEIPALLEYIKNQTDYPYSVIEGIMEDVRKPKKNDHILLIDGVENALPQLTKYRVENKIEQLTSLGFDVWHIGLSQFQMGLGEYASHIIIYRAPYTEQLGELCRLAKSAKKPVLYDIDDLVIDTKYTDQLSYTQSISVSEKKQYDQGVMGYGAMLSHCDGAITTTVALKQELEKYQQLVLLNRNLASQELVEISENVNRYNGSTTTDPVKIGYFSGSITHNENFQLIQSAIVELLTNYPQVELHLVGYLDLPKQLAPYRSQIKTHKFVPWQELPELIRHVDINLAPLVDSIFNRSKSEIKWLEAALVKVPTIASNLGAFAEMIQDEKTGLLASTEEWYEKMEKLVISAERRKEIGAAAYQYVMAECTTANKQDELTTYLSK